jgi:YegS/Rv2252/BmrU family lipid kinase
VRSCGKAIRAARPTAREIPEPGDGILLRVLDRPRVISLAWAALCLVLFTLLSLAVVHGWGSLTSLDHRGEHAETWAVDSRWARRPLNTIEDAFGTLGMTILTAVLAGYMVARKHRRAAYFTVGVMVVTSVATTLLKVAIDRVRPPWQNPDEFLHSLSYPSGHASSVAALGGVVIVLVSMLVRRANVRRLAYVAVVLVVLLVGADRILLGRHYPSDVLGGYLLGAGVVLLGLAVYTPLPRSHAASSEPLPEVYVSERQLAVILNPIKVEDVGQFKAIVAAMAREAGWSTPSWHYTTIEDPGTGMASAAAVAGADLVLVCGGDGTVREVCAELAGTGIPVGIVPAGTGNLLARNLDIPLYIRAAIDVALTGQDRAIDLVKVSGDGFEPTHFMVMAGMGFDAAIMEGVNEDIKKRVGWLAYVLSALKSLMFPAVKVEVSVDGGEFTSHRARTVVVGNVGFLQAGMPLLPDAAIDDGVLDVVLLHPRKFLSWIPLAYRVLARRPRTDDLVNRMTGHTIVVRAATDTPRQLDGDSIGPGRELHMECIHGRLLVRVPR